MLSKGAPLTRKEKSFFGLTLVLCVGVAVFGYLSATPEIKVSPPAPLPSQNAHTFYLAAQTATIPARASVDPLLDYYAPRTDAEKAWLYSLPRRKAWLKTNANIGINIRKGQALPYRRPLKNWDDYGLETNYLSPGNTFVYKIVEARTYLQEDRADKSLDCAIDLVEIAGQITNGGIFSGRYQESALLDWAKLLVLESLEKASASDLQRAAKRLNGLMEKREPYKQTLSDWRNLEIDQMLKFMSGKPIEINTGTRIPPLGKNQLWRGYYLYVVGPGNDGINDASLYTYSKRAFIKSMDISFRAAQLDAIKPYTFKSSIPEIWYLRDLKYKLDNSRLGESTILARRRFLLLLLGLETFKKEKGAFPKQLSELSPKILDSLPVDPFSLTKSTFGFKNLGSDYLLYSVGNNNVDDVKPSAYKAEIYRNLDDIVFKHEIDIKNQIPAGTKPKKPLGKPPFFEQPSPIPSALNVP